MIKCSAIMGRVLSFIYSKWFLVCLVAALLVLLNVQNIQLRRLQKTTVHINANSALLREQIQNLPSWAKEQIQNDLAPYADRGITREMLDAAFYGPLAKTYRLVRIRIQDGVLSSATVPEILDSRQYRELLAGWTELSSLVRLPDLECVISLQDGFGEDAPQHPWLTFAKNQNNTHHVLIPDFKAMTGYATLRETVVSASRKWKWEKKESKAFWRGSATGGWFSQSNWESLPRSLLVDWSLSSPHLVDARFTQVSQADPEVASLMRAKGMLAKPVSRPDHLKYKYLVDVDGNSCSFERYFWVLLSNSVVLKQNSPNIQWYYRGLKPWHHYIPLKADLSDLAEKIEWARQHDKEAKVIAERASAFVDSSLSNEQILAYLYELLVSYAALQR